MPITLADAKLNTQDDYDAAVIDEFRKSSAVLDNLIFDTAVNPAGGGATLSYSYRRLATQRSAAFRQLNTEYEPQHVTTTKHTVDLAVLGGSYEIDRVLSHLGPATSDEIALQTGQLIKAANAKFCDAVINGDVAVDANGFDGLSKALIGSVTEDNTARDWSAFTDANTSLNVLDDLDELQALLDGPPTLLFANKAALAKLRSAARRSNMYVQAPVEGLLGSNNHEVTREQIGNLILVDAGAKDGTNDPIIPISETGTTAIYAVRVGMDGFHGVTTTTGEMMKVWLPDFTTAGAVKKGEVELGPVAPVLKATKAAAVLRNVKVR